MRPFFSEPLKVERLNITIPKLPTSLRGTKIVQLSDLHYDGERISESLLAQAIAASNREEPDLVLLTGDYITTTPAPVADLALRLKYLSSRYGVYACLGNHDVDYPWAREKVTEAFTRIDIEVLWNAIATPLGEQFPLVGLADYWSREFKPASVFKHIDENLPRLVLSHNPDTAAILKRWRVDLQLSGHTHGGHIVIPGLGPVPALLPKIRRVTPKRWHRRIPYLQECSSVVKNWQWASGLHQIGSNLLYVNRGLGTYFPGRFLCPPEVTVITLNC